MKLIDKSIVETFEHEGYDYSRTNGNWQKLYGESWEQCYSEEDELEILYQASKTNSTELNLKVELFDNKYMYTQCEKCSFDNAHTLLDEETYDTKDICFLMREKGLCDIAIGKYFRIIEIDGEVL